MEPFTVKAYGFFEVTEKKYKKMQTITFTILALLFISTFIFDIDQFLFGHAKTIILGAAFLEGVETYFLLNKFKEHESLNTLE